jgi:tetratricopeptide (TPR) repeat protein
LGVGVELDQANVLLSAGRIPEAVSLLSRVVARRPREARALHMLGVAQAQSGNFTEALKQLQAAKALAPKSATVLTDLATVMLMSGQAAAAVPLLEKARQLDPRLLAAQFYLGNAFTALNRHADALDIFEDLSKREPTNTSYQQNRAALLLELGRLEEAVAAADKILQRQPSFVPALVLKSRSLIERERFIEAIEACDRAISIDRNAHAAHNNRGVALMALDRFDEALASFDRAIALQPDYADAIYNRGHLHLLLGRFEQGWKDHESRWNRKHFAGRRPAIEARQWRGEDLKGRSLAVYSEQGFGDTLQFCRYIPLLVERGARICFIAPQRLHRLLATLSPAVQLAAAPRAGQHFDFQIALLSIPQQMATNLSNIPAAIPYLSAEPDRVARWKSRIGTDGYKVGIAWQGNRGVQFDRERSFALSELYPLARIAGVRVISLQKGDGQEQLAELPADIRIEAPGEDFDSGDDAFLDSAAVMQSLDLVISPNTAITHLAGALGRPLWVALNKNAEWRWLRERRDSPWYPTATLFRQTAAGDWSSVFVAIAEKLRSLTS